MGSKVCILIGAAKQGVERSRLMAYADLDGPDKAMVYCADGGLGHAAHLGLKPDYLIGDFDSLIEEAGGKSGMESPANLPENIMRLPVKKDETDLFACILEALKNGLDEFVMIYCTGGRLDHFMGAMAALEYISKQGAKGIILDAQNEIAILRDGELILDTNPLFPYLSLLPLDPMLLGVTITGVKYPLYDAVLYREIGLGISNEILETQGRIRIESGAAFIIRSRDQ